MLRRWTPSAGPLRRRSLALAPASVSGGTVRVAIVSDVRLYREGLALLLRREPRIEPVAAAADVGVALDAIRELAPDVVLLDDSLEASVEAVRALVAAEPEARVVVLAAPEREPEVLAYAEAGVAGYVTRDADAEALAETIDAVACGGTLCSPAIAGALLRRVTTLASAQAPPPAGLKLTFRELEIAELIGRGLSNKEIAGRLCIAVATVKNHVHSILEKLEVRRRSEIATVLRR